MYTRIITVILNSKLSQMNIKKECKKLLLRMYFGINGKLSDNWVPLTLRKMYITYSYLFDSIIWYSKIVKG